MRKSLTLVALLLLAACGRKTDLERPADAPPPPVPYGREEALTSEELLTPGTMEVPARSVELETRSEERQDDPFELPPES